MPDRRRGVSAPDETPGGTPGGAPDGARPDEERAGTAGSGTRDMTAPARPAPDEPSPGPALPADAETAPAGAAGAMVDRLSRLTDALTTGLGRNGDVVLRQLPFTGLFLVALVTLPVLQDVRSLGVGAATVLALGQLLLAVLLPWRRWPDWWQDALPALQIVAVAVLRGATGGPQSLYTSMVFVPVIALAARPGRRGPVLGATGAAAVILGPVLVDPRLELTASVLVRGAFVTLVAGVIALTVHRVTDRLRAQTDEARALRDVEQDLRARLEADAVELARVSDLRRQARDQLVSVIDSATEQAIIATDAAGVVEVFNRGAERLLGRSAAEVVGVVSLTDLHRQDELEARWNAMFADAAPADDPHLLIEALVAPALAGRPETRDWTYVRRDGSHVVVRLAITRRVDVDGTVVGYVVVATDVTAEREASALKEQFVSLVSHELRTPLTSVLGYLELLADEDLTDEQREYVTVIERNARRQLRLVGDLLLTAQVDAGTFSVSPQRVDAADIARASAESAGPQAAAAGVAVETDLTPSPVDADPVRLAQAVDNILSNAVKFTPSGGTVRLVVGPDRRGEPGGVRLTVTDTGIGIPPDELERLTQRFFRASTATRRAIPGIGLGLSIAKAVVDAHGGELQITSTVGEGTAFTIALPPPV
ncbi:ATP-binding protein [Cellulomonas massiliensis]|uniref:ATP-binding protein n=1 Tax=Cellulomonas massiliensis TaxID=1465811 RepID=UPI0002DAAC45|nr:ATP-binding protein [Cellulomonas massiliensis]